MINRICRTAVIIIVIVFETAAVYGEYIFLKTGEIKAGQIVSETASTVTIRSRENKRESFQRSEIIRVLYTELYMGKVYVQKTDGKNEICYMVDEDRETYTFRRELYAPQEFQLRREEVLFMARGNPSGLKGEADTDRVSLKWFPPYNPVKKYRLYMREETEKKFAPADEFRGTELTLKNLKSNTKYVFYVSAVDESGDESLPSNELKITTLNIRPPKPGNLRYEKRDVEKTETVKGKKHRSTETKRYIVWDPVNDVDGEIKGYNIYYVKDGVNEKISVSTGAEYEIPEGKSVYDLRITAFDDRSDESPASRIRHPRALKMGLQPFYFAPQGKLGEMFEPGFGLLASISFKNFFYQNLEWGFSGGVVELSGKDSEKYDSMMLVPVTLDMGYHFHLNEWLSLVPFISAGYTWMGIKYISLFQEMNKTASEPLARAGAAISFEFDYFHISAGADYGAIYESSGYKPFYEIFLRAGLLFDL